MFVYDHLFSEELLESFHCSDYLSWRVIPLLFTKISGDGTNEKRSPSVTTGSGGGRLDIHWRGVEGRKTRTRRREGVTTR